MKSFFFDRNYSNFEAFWIVFASMAMAHGDYWLSMGVIVVSTAVQVCVEAD